MSESRPNASQTCGPPCMEDTAPTRVTFDELSRVPAQRLARLLLERAAEDPTLLSRLYQTVDLRESAPSRTNRPAIVGDSLAMRRVMALVRRFEQTDEPVLVTGESGTGKELVARAIHEGSHRAHGPFVAVNCAAIPSSLAASELFGYEKGAFTGAAARGIGQIEHAKGGTLFLDEIGDMIRRVGGRETIGVDVRIVSATNVRLAAAIAEGRFREDLFYRLNVLSLAVPPLRERPEDIPPLACHFLEVARRDFRRPVTGFAPEAMAALCRHRWPGNVRELMSVVRRAVVIGDGPLIESAALAGLDGPPAQAQAAPKPGSAEERTTLLATLVQTNENVTSTADALHVSRVTLYRMLRRHGIVLKRGLAHAPVARRPAHMHG